MKSLFVEKNIKINILDEYHIRLDFYFRRWEMQMKSKQMKISVLTVVFNGEKEIRKTIESVLNQIDAPYEYLIIDGESYDDTVVIAKEYQKEFDKKNIVFKIISEPDDGIYDAFNKGVMLATGEYISFLNCGDWYNNNTLSIVYREYNKKPFDFAYGSISYVGKKGNCLIKKSKIDTFISSRNWNHPSSFVRRQLYVDYPFNLKFKVYADFDWFLKMRKKNINITIFPTDEIIANFRAGGISINKNLKASLERAKEKYSAYKDNGYEKYYWIEAYGWECIKYLFALIYS